MRTVNSYSGYSGNYWAIVLGPKDESVAPVPIRQFVRTAFKNDIKAAVQREYLGSIVRVIRQPVPPLFEAGM